MASAGPFSLPGFGHWVASRVPLSVMWTQLSTATVSCATVTGSSTVNRWENTCVSPSSAAHDRDQIQVESVLTGRTHLGFQQDEGSSVGLPPPSMLQLLSLPRVNLGVSTSVAAGGAAGPWAGGGGAPAGCSESPGCQST